MSCVEINCPQRVQAPSIGLLSIIDKIGAEIMIEINKKLRSTCFILNVV